MTDLVIDLMLTDDMIAEGLETFTVDLSNATGPTGINVSVDSLADSVTTTINDTMGIAGTPDEAVFSITGTGTANEGTTAQYTVELTGALGAGESVSVEIGLDVIDTNSADYASFVAAISTAAATNPDVSFDNATGVLTYTSPTDGATMTPLLIDLGINTDTLVEGDEDFAIELSTTTSSTGVAVSIDPAENDVVTTITDTTAPLEWQISGPASADEGGEAQYFILLNGNLGAGETATVQIDLNDLTTNPSDHADVLTAITTAVAADSNVTFDTVTSVLAYTAPSDGATLAPIIVSLEITNDTLIEGPEQFEITLSNPGSTTGAAVNLSATANRATTIINDTQELGGTADGPAEFSITGDSVVVEGSTANYSISLSGEFGAGEVVSVDLGLNSLDTTLTDYSDFIAAVNDAVAAYTGPGAVTFDGTTLTFTAAFDGDTMNDLLIDLSTVDDTLVEGDETFSIALSNPSTSTGANVTIDSTNSSINTTITDNDLATFSLTGDTTVAESNNAQYTLSLNGSLQAGESASVQIDLTDIDTSSSDYGAFVAAINTAVAANPDVSFDSTMNVITYTAPTDGASLAGLTFELPINSDGISEAPEDFTIELSNPASSSGLSPTIDPTAQDVTTTINGSPVLQLDFAQTNIDTSVSNNVLTNDSDPDGDLLTVTEVNGQPIGSPISTTFGSVLVNANGDYTYIPNPGFFGTDTFTYSVIDSEGNTETSTVEIFVNNAEIGVAKAASDPIPNGENSDITFTLVVENLGNASIADLQLIDDLNANFGSSLTGTTAPIVQNFSGTGTPPAVNTNWVGDTSQNLLDSAVLNAGESFEVVFTVTIDPDADGMSGSLSNQATVSGQGLNADGSDLTDNAGNPIIASDISDDGSDPDGENGSDNGDGVFGNDPTEILIADLGIAKSVTELELLFSGNYVVTYQVVIENTGTVDLANLSLLEDLSTQFGPAFVNAGDLTLVVDPTNPVSNIAVDAANFNGSTNISLVDGVPENVLAAGDSFTIEFMVEVNPLATSGPVSNQVFGSGVAVDASGAQLTDSNNNPITGTDLSDSGTDPNSSNPGDPNDSGSAADPTLFDFPPLPLGEIAGSVFVDENNNGFREPGENGIESVEITLTGTDVFGNAVDITALTDADGQYTFGGLNAGFYTLSQTQPLEFTDGIDRGDPSFTVGNDVFSNIVLFWGQQFDSNTFGEQLPGASGFPPDLPTLGPIANSPIGALLDNFTASRPIYSGTPFGSNANPLSFDNDSGGVISGGYSVINNVYDFSLRANSIEELGTFVTAETQAEPDQAIAVPTELTGEISEDEIIAIEGEDNTNTTSDEQSQGVHQENWPRSLNTDDKPRRPSFLKRFFSRLSR